MFLTSVIRTIVPGLYALLISWLLVQLPFLEPLRELLMEQSEVIILALQGAAIGGWYAFVRWLEPRIPGWARAILMGSTKTPVYPEGKHVQDH